MTADTHDPLSRTGRPRRLAGYIAPAWRQRSRTDTDLERVLAATLGSLVVDGGVRVSLRDDTLILCCPDRASATELRFLQREIRKTLAAAGHPSVAQVRTVLDTGNTTAMAEERSTQTVPRTIPLSARQALRSAAASVTDPRLRAALNRLADAGTR